MAGVYIVELNAEAPYLFDTSISWSFLDYTDPSQLPAEYASEDQNSGDPHFNNRDLTSDGGSYYYYYNSVSVLTTDQRDWIKHLFAEIERFTKLTFDDAPAPDNAGDLKFGNASLIANAPINGGTIDVNGITPG